MPHPNASAPAWRDRLAELLPLDGHRNWIVIADAAFPAQVGAVEVVASSEPHVPVVAEVLAALRSAPHVTPVVWLDAELSRLTDDLAPGASAERGALAGILAGLDPQPVWHAELLQRLAEVARAYRILVIKTNGTVPYSSVFVELDCGYWPAEGEAELRKRIAAGTQQSGG